MPCEVRKKVEKSTDLMVTSAKGVETKRGESGALGVKLEVWEIFVILDVEGVLKSDARLGYVVGV